MSIRPFKLPADVPLMLELIPPAFQYPENEAWSVRDDEVESMVETFDGLRRIWLLFRFAQIVSPPLRDALRGYIWEEDGQAVGLVNVIRQGASDVWYIGNVAVLPDYRRRGIARRLVDATVEYARERGGKTIALDVVAGNVPAYALYERLGFEHFTGSTEFEREAGAEPPPECPLPDGYTIAPLGASDWRPRYELARRITPSNVQKYQPVEEARFRQPAVVRLLMPVFMRAMGMRNKTFAVRADDQQIVAVLNHVVRVRGGGINHMNATLDPAHAALAPCLVSYLARAIHAQSSERRIEFSASHWQPALAEAASAAGFAERYEAHTMGMAL